MNKWFSETFLPSIYERCKGRGREMWLSQKQTAVCIQNMELHQVRFDPDGYGVRCTHNNYKCDWNGRKVVLSYSKKNGCGYISFGMNEEEEAAHRRKVEEEKAEAERNTVARRKADPERLAKIIAYYTHKIEVLQARWDGEKEEAYYDKSDEEWYIEEMANLKAKLAMYT